MANWTIVETQSEGVWIYPPYDLSSTTLKTGTRRTATTEEVARLSNSAYLWGLQQGGDYMGLALRVTQIVDGKVVLWGPPPSLRDSRDKMIEERAKTERH